MIIGLALRRLRDPIRPDLSSIASELSHVCDTLTTEAAERAFLQVMPDRTMLVDKAALFGDDVLFAFPSAQSDLKEAGNCLACECNTAAVFHLMRASEVALRALAKDRLLTYPNSSVDEQQCGTLITSLDSKLNALRGSDKKLWPSEAIKNEQIRFYHTAAIEFRSFNEAWRKHVAHAGADAFYDRSQAYSIFEHVKRFMQILSTKIGENVTTPEYWVSL